MFYQHITNIMKLTRKAHAKLNLFLEVTAKRADGYHELYSLAVFLDLADQITVEPAAAITVRENGNDSGIKNNIIYKTAAHLAEKYKAKSGARITFTKNIPIGAGLGGGSADAAATMILLNNLWSLGLTHSEFYETGLELGADIPVCLYSILENKNAAIFKGIGETIEEAPKLPPMFFTLANPGIELATKDVFANFKYEGLGFEEFPEKGDVLKNIIQRSNDLEPSAIELVPHIQTAIKDLSRTKNCQLARMTGSGATSFGIYKSRRDSRTAAVTLIKKHPTWQIGPVALKPTTSFSPLQKLRRRFLHKQVSTLRSLRDSKFSRELAAIFAILHVKTRWGRAFCLSFVAHIIALFFYDTSFLTRHLPAQTEFITVAFAIENPPPEETNNVANYETAAGEIPQLMPSPIIAEAPKPVVKKKAVAHKKTTNSSKKLGAKPKLLNGSANGNSTAATAKPAVKDYLELLQYTVQERSEVHSTDPNLRGKAIIRLVFNRHGYVLTYKLRQKTGIQTLDSAAEKLAKNLMENPLPTVPEDFERGAEILQYDFVVSYPPKAKDKG